MGGRDTVLHAVQELLTFSEKYCLPAYSAYGIILRSWVYGDIKQVDSATDSLWNMGQLGITQYKSSAADSEAAEGNFNAAMFQPFLIDALLSHIYTNYFLQLRPLFSPSAFACFLFSQPSH